MSEELSTQADDSKEVDFLEKLRTALRTDGDFPASAKIVNRLKELTNDPRVSAHQVTEIILREPSLSTRLLHLVNSSLYRRAKPIVTVSQAVIAVGMKPIAELCAGLVLLQRFIPMARRGGTFADCFKRSMVTSLLSSSFSAEIGGNSEGSSNELGYISGFFSELGTVLLAYYFPKMYETAAERAKQRGVSIDISLKQITGFSPVEISKEVIRSLNLPSFYLDVLTASQDRERLIGERHRALEEEKIVVAAKSVGAGHVVSVAIESGDKAEVDKAFSQVASDFAVDAQSVATVISNLPRIFKEHCELTDIMLPALPSFLEQYGNDSTPRETVVVEASDSAVVDLINDIRLAIENREPAASVITSMMEVLMFGAKFERVALLLFDNQKKNLIGKMMLGGAEGFDAASLVRAVSPESNSTESLALRDGRPAYQGTPLFADGWPFVFIPLGSFKRGLGIVYADRISKDQELSFGEKATIGLLTELVERLISSSK